MNKKSFGYDVHVIHINHLQLIAWKGALFWLSTDSVHREHINTYLHFVGEMGMNTSTQSPVFVAKLCNLYLESIMHESFH